MLSIIIPYYNKSKFFRKTVNSINDAFLNSPLENDQVEIIVVNDGSTNEESALLNDILSYCTVQFCIINQENSGVSSARNAGLRSAQGEYIYFLDADDEVLPELFIFINKISNKTNEGYALNYIFPLAINRTIRLQPFEMVKDTVFDDEIFLKMLNKSTLHLSCIVFSRKFIRNTFFEDGVKSGEDLLYIYDALINSRFIASNSSKPIAVYKYDGKFHTVSNNGLSKILLKTKYQPLQNKLVYVLNTKAYMENCFFDSNRIVDKNSVPLSIKFLCFFKSSRLYSLLQSLRFFISV